MSRNARVEVCVGAAIFRDGRLLLLRRALDLSAFPGTWDIPGGHVGEGEGLLTALRREIREETGFAVKVIRPFHAGTFDYPMPNGGHVPTVEVDFLCSTKSKSPPRLAPDEHTDYAWVARYDPRKFPAPPLLRAIIRKAFASR
jgi:8-oxo-dGTP diphosphatase